MASKFQQVFQAQSQSEPDLMRLPNVVGVAVGYREADGDMTDEPALVVLVQQKKPLSALSVDERVPERVRGARTDVYEVGYLQAQQATNPKGRIRPIPGGVSLSHYKVTAGTFGVMVRDRTTGERLILSNNHVLANSNEAMVGDDIMQPGPIDGGIQPDDVVARLERFVPLNYVEGPVTAPEPPEDPGNGGGGDGPQPSGCDVVDLVVGLANVLASVSGSEKRVTTTQSAQLGDDPHTNIDLNAMQEVNNLVDAALARPIDPDMFLDEILQIGEVKEATAPELNMNVRKYGRTTQLTQSRITLLNATVEVNYSTSKGTRTARFTGQVIADAFSQGGDSGSLVVDANSNRAVGLLFGGSPLATIFTPINTVLTALNIRLGD